MNLLITGAPGAGKGTMSQKIIEEYHIPHISSGQMFRDAMATDTPIGNLAKTYIDQGLLVPDQVTIDMVMERLTRPDCKDGFLLDGFPRTLIQAKYFADVSSEMNRSLDGVINIVIDFDVLAHRITGRRVCSNCGAIYHIDNKPPKVEGQCDLDQSPLIQRSDDTKEQLEIRMGEYHHLTEPVLKFYSRQGLVYNINGNQSIEDVFEDIKKVMEQIDGK